MAFVEEQDPPVVPPLAGEDADADFDIGELHLTDVENIILTSTSGHAVGLEQMNPHAIDVCLYSLLQARKGLVGDEGEWKLLAARLAHSLV